MSSNGRPQHLPNAELIKTAGFDRETIDRLSEDLQIGDRIVRRESIWLVVELKHTFALGTGRVEATVIQIGDRRTLIFPYQYRVRILADGRSPSEISLG